MIRHLFFLLLSCMVHAAIAQEAVLLDLKTYGGDGSDGVGKHVLRTDDGGFLLSFGTQSTLGSGSIATLCTGGGARSVYLKYNASASSLLWSKCSAVGGGAYMFPRSDGSFYFGQQLSIPGGSTVRVRSEDADENLLWSRQYGSGASPFLRGMIACEDGGYIIVCEVFYTDTDVVSHYGSWSNADIWAMKVDADGYKVWSKVIGGTGDEIVFSISSAPGDGCYILGTTQSNDYDCTGNHGGIDAYVVRLDKDGNILWHRDLGGSELDGGLFGMVVLNEGGGPLITAVTESSDGDVHHHIGGQDYWVINMDSNGNIIWENCYGSTTIEYPTAICRATDGSVWVIGTSFGMAGQVHAHYGGSDAWVAHADANGNFINGKVLGGTGSDGGTMIYPLDGGSVLAGGGFRAANGSFSEHFYFGGGDIFLAKLAPWSIGVPDVSQANIGLWPNPATGSVQISAEQSGVVSVTDIAGRQMYADAIARGIPLKMDVSTWPAGMYVVQHTLPDGSRRLNRLIVQ